MANKTISYDEHAPLEASLTVVMPAYNEESAIVGAVEEMMTGLPLYVTAYELIVVDDGSRDLTSERLRELAAKHSCMRIITHSRNRGYGAAFVSGISDARMEWVLMVDADQQIGISELPAFLAASREQDVVIGYRQERHDSVVRRALSAGYRRLLRASLGIRVLDINCPFKLIKRDLIMPLELVSQGFFIYAELLHSLAKKGFEPVQLPVVFHDRRHGRSTVRFRHVRETLGELMALRSRECARPGGPR